jgi:hypothetical protein
MSEDISESVEGGGIEHDGPDGGVPQEIQGEIRWLPTVGFHSRGDEARGIERDEESGITAVFI